MTIQERTYVYSESSLWHLGSTPTRNTMKITNISVIHFKTLFTVCVNTAHKGAAQICAQRCWKIKEQFSIQ